MSGGGLGRACHVSQSRATASLGHSGRGTCVHRCCTVGHFFWVCAIHSISGHRLLADRVVTPRSP